MVREVSITVKHAFSFSGGVNMIVTDVFAPEAINPLGVYVNFSK